MMMKGKMSDKSDAHTNLFAEEDARAAARWQAGRSASSGRRSAHQGTSLSPVNKAPTFQSIPAKRHAILDVSRLGDSPRVSSPHPERQYCNVLEPRLLTPSTGRGPENRAPLRALKVEFRILACVLVLSETQMWFKCDMSDFYCVIVLPYFPGSSTVVAQGILAFVCDSRIIVFEQISISHRHPEN
jgi:hypothetical protein